jgi:hypothetical protein
LILFLFMLLSLLGLCLPARAQTALTWTFTDAAGADDIGQAHMLVTGNGTGNQACYLIYSQTDNMLGLLTDAGANPTVWTVAGGAGVLLNSQCSIAAAGFRADAAGNVLTLTETTVFATAFAGVKALMQYTYTKANVGSGWAAAGNFTVLGAPVVAGVPGPPGKQGIQGIQGIPGLQGAPGLPGTPAAGTAGALVIKSVAGSGALYLDPTGNLDINPSVSPTKGAPQTWGALQTMLGGVSLLTPNPQPGCVATSRGMVWYVNGGAAKDSLQVCAFNGSAFAWAVLY